MRTLIFATLLLCACNSGPATTEPAAPPAPAPDLDRPSADGIDPRKLTLAPMGELVDGCPKAFVDGPLKLRTTFSEKATKTNQGEAYFLDDCDPAGFDASCGLKFGSQFCMNRHWTTMCKSDAQCPRGTRCTDGSSVGDIDLEYSDYGWCAASCGASAAKSACARSDFSCEKDLGVCLRTVELEPAEAEAEEEGEGHEAGEGHRRVFEAVTKARHTRLIVPSVYRVRPSAPRSGK
jgi:hypothetical protein